jgi:hypothetical protein
MDEQALNDAMASGDLDALDALLDQYDDVEEVDESAQPAAKPTEKVENTATTAAEGEGDKPNSDNEATAQERVVLSKDGKHTIPYEVLENARSRAQKLEQENQQLQAITGERDKLQALLEKHGIDMNAEDLDGKTDDELQELADDFPVVGKVIAKQAQKIQELEGKLNQQQSEPAANSGKTAVVQAFESIPELVSWQAGDKDRLEYAVAKDAELMSDPIWQDKPVRERFLEAVRRTQSAFGDKLSAQPGQQQQRKQAKQGDGLPNSPSELGNSVRESSAKGTPEYYASLSPDELQREMLGMSPDAIDQLLRSIDY